MKTRFISVCALIFLLLFAFLGSIAQSQILEAVELINDQPELSRVTSIEISPDGRYLYAISPAAQLVSAYARDAQTGLLTLVDSEPYDTAGITSGRFGSQARLIQDARFLLVGSLFENGSDLASYQRDELSGELTLLNDAMLSLTDDQRMLRFAVSPSGDFLYVLVLDIIDPEVTTSRTINLRSYTISDSGTIILIDTRLIQDIGPAVVGESLNISPDGQHLYVTGIPSIFIGDNRPGLYFSRNTVSGLLTLLGNLDELSPLGLPAATFSIDGTTLYYRATVQSDPPFSIIGSLSREQSSGLLGFAEETVVSFVNRPGFDDALALAANDRLLATSDRLGLYLTPSPGGEFINLESEISNSLTAETLAGAVTFSPDEAFLYVALTGGINAADGMLVFRHRGLLEPPAVPALSALASLLLIALLLAAAAYYHANKSASRVYQ
jgi:WD40 repeat protein